MIEWKPIAVVIAGTLALAACGTNPVDRAVSGGAIGAATGAAAGALIPGLPVWGGAAIGAGVGAVAGVLTDEKQINLGKPPWR